MVTTLAAAILFSCKPAYYPDPMPRPPVTMACEGGDKVYRNHDGLESQREVNGCTIARCEGTDRVRRTYGGAQVSRAVNACTVARCEGWDFVVRTNDGQPLSRVSSAQRCIPANVYTPVVVRPPQSDALRYGLSYR